MAEYYNEIDPFCVEWLKNLITAKLIAAGDVDSRSITEVTADDVKGYTQCHFFAGIAGWSYALRLAGVSDDQQVWTGSCPCQPFSNAGKRKGFDDERHLWPEFARLIGDCRPPIVFGEQVEAAIRWGWLDSVFTDLEAKDYTCWAAVLPACGVGAPHIRQRLWWVGHHTSKRLEGAARKSVQGRSDGLAVSSAIFLADRIGARLEIEREQSARQERAPAERSSEASFLEHATGEQMGFSGCAREQGSAVGELGDSGSEGRRQVREDAGRRGEGSRTQGLAERSLHERDGDSSRLGIPDSERSSTGGETAEATRHRHSTIPANWDDLEWLPCIDGKWRPVKSGLQPLAHGVSGRMVARSSVKQSAAEIPQENRYSRVGALRAFGNAIVPPLAAEFIAAAMEYAP